MKKVIAVLFCITDTNFLPQIKEKLQELKDKLSEDIKIAHVVPQAEYEQDKGLSSDFRVLLEEMFPDRLVYFFSPKKEQAEIALMCKYTMENSGELYIIGEISGEEEDAVRTVLSSEHINVFPIDEMPQTERVSFAPAVPQQPSTDQLVGVAFTLKGQDFSRIEPILEEIANYPVPDGATMVLVHGFLTRKVCEEKGIPLTVVDALDRLFPVQTGFYDEENGVVNREAMADYLNSFKGIVYVIGEVKEGVAEEVELYKSKGDITIEFKDLAPEVVKEPATGNEGGQPASSTEGNADTTKGTNAGSGEVANGPGSSSEVEQPQRGGDTTEQPKDQSEGNETGVKDSEITDVEYEEEPPKSQNTEEGKEAAAPGGDKE